MVFGKDNDNGIVEYPYERPVKLSKWQAFKKAIYDPQTHQFMGRTCKNWGQLLLFYILFYVVLAGLFAICMQGLFATLDMKEPRWKLDTSLIGNNPGLGFRPISDRVEDGSLIRYNTANSSSVNRWVGLIDKFLAPYQKAQVGDNYIACDYGKGPGKGQVCVTKIDKLKNCNPGRKYGYESSSPCIFLKLNRIFGWKPEFYTTAQPDMPADLKDHIEKNTVSEEEKRQIWVSCSGVDGVDKENINSFNYYPRGFPGYYYPYTNEKNYLSPLVAVEIVNLTPFVTVSIECRAWAKNIVYRGGSLNRAGSVQFEIQLDTVNGTVSISEKVDEHQH